LLELIGNPPLSPLARQIDFFLSGVLPATTPHLIVSPAAGSRATASALVTVIAQSMHRAHHAMWVVPGRAGNSFKLQKNHNKLCETQKI
jgi:hypothetical protein